MFIFLFHFLPFFSTVDDTYMYDDAARGSIRPHQMGHWYDEPPYESDPDDFLMGINAGPAAIIQVWTIYSTEIQFNKKHSLLVILLNLYNILKMLLESIYTEIYFELRAQWRISTRVWEEVRNQKLGLKKSPQLKHNPPSKLRTMFELHMKLLFKFIFSKSEALIFDSNGLFI